MNAFFQGAQAFRCFDGNTGKIGEIQFKQALSGLGFQT